LTDEFPLYCSFKRRVVSERMTEHSLFDFEPHTKKQSPSLEQLSKLLVEAAKQTE